MEQYLEGYHLNGLAAAGFSKNYKENSMFAYVNDTRIIRAGLDIVSIKHFLVRN